MIDIHMHSTYSDGDKTVEELLKMCEEKRLEYISITDHNTCAAYYDEALKNNNIFSGTIIKGCELNANFQNKAIEILGYNINPDDIMIFREKYYSINLIQKNAKKIYDNFLSILDKEGIIYNIENINPYQKHIERLIYEEIIKHPANKKILGEEYFNSLEEFFRKEIANPNSKYFLNRVGTFPKVTEVVDTIHKAGGKAFLAHPFEYKFDDTIGFINDLRKEVELDGIECFHPSSAEENKKDILVDFARKNNLYISGGSDYHGKLKPDIQIGLGRSNLSISKEFIEEWFK